MGARATFYFVASADLDPLVFQKEARMSNHPNAAAAAVSTGPAVLIVWVLGLTGLEIDPLVAAAIAGAVVSAGLLVGRRGVKGLASLVWRGGP
jgi:hypothetical protein